MMKELISLAFLLITLTAISGCKLEGGEKLNNFSEFVSRTGLQVDFQADAPPDFNWKGEEFPIKVNITNKGEYALLLGEAKIELSGDFLGSEFEADKNSQAINQELGSGQSIELSLGNAKYIGEINKSKIVQAAVKIYYPYKSNFKYAINKEAYLVEQKAHLLGKKNFFLSEDVSWGHYCYAVLNKNDTYCRNLENNAWRYICYTDVNNDDSYCKNIRDETWKNYCYAVRNKEDTYCKNIRDGPWKNYCYAIVNEDISYCKNLGDWYAGYKCFNDVTWVMEINQRCQKSNYDNSNYCSAILTNESAYCNKINDEEVKNFCFSFVVERTHIYSLCDNVKNSTFLFDACKTDIKYEEGCKNAEKKLLKYTEYEVNKIDDELKKLNEEIALLNKTTEEIFLSENEMAVKSPIQIAEKNVSRIIDQLQIDFLIKNIGGGFVSSNCKKSGEVLVKTNNLACSELDSLDEGVIKLENKERILHCKVKDISKDAFLNLSYEYQREFKKDILLVSEERKYFSGGIGELFLDFMLNAPPDFNWKNEEFSVKVNITNKGEYALLPGEAKIELSGDFLGSEFEADKNPQAINQELGSGQSIEFSLGNVKYVGEINKSKIVQASVKLGYPYKTKFRTDLYTLGSNVFYSEEGFASAGPVVILWPTFYLVNDKIGVDIDIENTAEGFIKGKIEVTPLSDNIVCPSSIGLENKTAMLHCEIKNIKDNPHVAIDLDYNYQQEFKKSIMIRDREAFPFD